MDFYSTYRPTQNAAPCTFQTLHVWQLLLEGGTRARELALYSPSRHTCTLTKWHAPAAATFCVSICCAATLVLYLRCVLCGCSWWQVCALLDIRSPPATYVLDLVSDYFQVRDM
jgi:hypothetical protein